jgi:hypothetical protein
VALTVFAVGGFGTCRSVRELSKDGGGLLIYLEASRAYDQNIIDAGVNPVLHRLHAPTHRGNRLHG